MAENGHWDTSKALVRRTLEQCIHLGRQHRAQGQKQDEYEAYRLLGQAVSRHDRFTPPCRTDPSSSFIRLRILRRIQISAS